jgi:hypothetical protein
MEAFVAHKLNEFETGKITRRKLIETLTLAATMGAAEAQNPDPALKAQLINHFSYTCPNFREAADWYSKIFNLDQVGATNHDVALPFGKKGDKPYGVTADDVPLTHLIIRSRDSNAPAAGAAQNRPAREAVIDHIAFTVADFNRDRAVPMLQALGVKNVHPLNINSVHMDDPFGYDVQISGLDETAFYTPG